MDMHSWHSFLAPSEPLDKRHVLLQILVLSSQICQPVEACFLSREEAKKKHAASKSEQTNIAMRQKKNACRVDFYFTKR